MYETILLNGTIIDGTGAAPYRADLGIQGDRIQHIGDLHGAQAERTIDVSDKVVSPGFVDVHNHSDAWLLKVPHLVPKTIQGFTSEVIMADGISYAPVDEHTNRHWIYYMRALNGLQFEEYQGWHSLAEYMEAIDGNNVQNVITHIPYANLRSIAFGWDRSVPDDFQMEQLQRAVEEGMAAGAVGLSTGLDYISECFATTDELVEVCAPMAAAQGLYVTHVRYKKGTLAGVKEAVEIGRRANVPVHISHFKASTPEETDILLSYVDKVAVNEVDFSFDVYPYLPGSTMLNFMLPYDIWENGPLGVLPRLNDPQVRHRFSETLKLSKLENIHIAWLPGRENSRHIGKLLSQYVEEVGGDPADALCDLLIEENLAVLLVFHHGDDTLIHPYLTHDKYMMGTDGIYFPDSAVHPRMYGSAARILGPCVRDHKLFSLTEAVYKLSGYPAARFGLKDRGTLAEGKFADIVVFDPDRMQDRATYSDPHQLSEGVEHVLVNGVPIIAAGEPISDLTHPLPGRYLKFNQ